MGKGYKKNKPKIPLIVIISEVDRTSEGNILSNISLEAE